MKYTYNPNLKVRTCPNCGQKLGPPGSVHICN